MEMILGPPDNTLSRSTYWEIVENTLMGWALGCTEHDGLVFVFPIKIWLYIYKTRVRGSLRKNKSPHSTYAMGPPLRCYVVI